MRRDVGFYLEAKIDRVYDAYLKAATNPPFSRTCKATPLHTISFGVNYSFKYNMNGGSCNIHLMPYGSGTAVNIRFSIAQGVGARCEKYAQDLNRAMQVFLPVVPRPAAYQMEDFLKPENQVTALQPSAAPAAPAAPAVPAETALCSACSTPLTPNARFCSQCGAPVPAPTQKTCPNCQAQMHSSAAFCTNCGTRL